MTINLKSFSRRGAMALAAAALLAAGTARAQDAGTDDPHFDAFSESAYPRASQCAACHRQIYDEWRGSSHAYAAVSPVFHKFEQAINTLAPTIGAFCVRCHISTGTAMDEPREMPIWERAQVSREGVTCVTCHRVDENYGKVNGERRIVPGDIILEVGQREVNSPQDVEERIARLKSDGRKTALLTLSNSAGDLRFTALRLED